MKIYVVGSTKNRFFKSDESREKFFVNVKHDGDNCDFLNPLLCEMTGLYYLWKHVDDEIVGLEHYRRYMTVDGKPITESEAELLLDDCDLLCPIAKYSKAKPVRTWVDREKRWGDFNYFLDFVRSYVGEDYYQACIKALDSDYHLRCNMFIARKKFSDEYCEFIFDVIFSFLKHCKDTNHFLSSRIIGYITEFLFMGFCLYRNKKWKIIDFRLIK